MDIEKFSKSNVPEERFDTMPESPEQRWFSYLEKHKKQIPHNADGVILTTQEGPGTPGVYYLWIQHKNGGHALMRLANGFEPDTEGQGIVDESGQHTRTFELAYAIQFSPDGKFVGDISELANLHVSSEGYFYDTHNQLEGVSQIYKIEDRSK